MQGMHHCNVTILDGDNQLTHWTGSPSQEGGAMKLIDMSPVGGPPVFDFCPGGNDREQMKFNVDTKVLGANTSEQNAFIAKYARGTIFINPNISGLPTGVDWVVENALIKHSADSNTPSTLAIMLAELRPTAGP